MRVQPIRNWLCCASGSFCWKTEDQVVSVANHRVPSWMNKVFCGIFLPLTMSGWVVPPATLNQEISWRGESSSECDGWQWDGACPGRHTHKNHCWQNLMFDIFSHCLCCCAACVISSGLTDTSSISCHCVSCPAGELFTCRRSWASFQQPRKNVKSNATKMNWRRCCRRRAGATGRKCERAVCCFVICLFSCWNIGCFI